MRYEPNLWGRVTCSNCGNSFMTDCGEHLCSSRCEDEYHEYHKKCERCGWEQEDNIFPDGEHCENCLDEMEEEQHEAV